MELKEIKDENQRCECIVLTELEATVRHNEDILQLRSGEKLQYAQAFPLKCNHP